MSSTFFAQIPHTINEHYGIPRVTQPSRSRALLAVRCGMQYTKLGASDLHVSRLCLGTMTFGEAHNYEEACTLLNLASDRGINFFDCAEMYPVPQRAATFLLDSSILDGLCQGLSEEFLGRWMQSCGRSRDKVIIATKVAGPSGQMEWIRGGPRCVDSSNIISAVEGSLKRLKSDYIDLYQIHWPDRYVPMFGDTDYVPQNNYAFVPFEDQLEGLSKAIAAGKIRHVGVSNETPWGVMKLCHLAEKYEPSPRIVSVQNAYSLLCRSFDSTLAEVCHREDIAFVAYSPLAMGLLSGKYHGTSVVDEQCRLVKYRGRYAEAEGRYPVDNHNVKSAVCEYVNIASKYSMSPVSMAIAFVLHNSLVSSAAFGVRNEGQLDDVILGCDVQLSDDALHAINDVHSRFPNPTP